MENHARRIAMALVVLLYAVMNLGCLEKSALEPKTIEGETVLVGDFDSTIIDLREFKILSTRIRDDLLQVRVFADDHCADGFGALMTPPRFDSTTPPSANIYVVNFGTGSDDCGDTEGRVSFKLREVAATYFRQFSVTDTVLLRVHGFRDHQLYELKYLPSQSGQ